MGADRWFWLSSIKNWAERDFGGSANFIIRWMCKCQIEYIKLFNKVGLLFVVGWG